MTDPQYSAHDAEFPAPTPTQERACPKIAGFVYDPTPTPPLPLGCKVVTPSRKRAHPWNAMPTGQRIRIKMYDGSIRYGVLLDQDHLHLKDQHGETTIYLNDEKQPRVGNQLAPERRPVSWRPL